MINKIDGQHSWDGYILLLSICRIKKILPNYHTSRYAVKFVGVSTYNVWWFDEWGGVKLDNILRTFILITAATRCHNCLLTAWRFIYRKLIIPSLFHSLCRHPFKSADTTASGHCYCAHLIVGTLTDKQITSLLYVFPTRIFNLVAHFISAFSLKSHQSCLWLYVSAG